MPDSDSTTEFANPIAATTSLRISEILETRRKEEGSWLRLEQAIKDAIERETRPSRTRKVKPKFVERRKLKMIVENDPKLVLSFGELLALDTYLEPLGHGLAYQPILQKPELMLQLAESGQLTFLLGSKRDQSDQFRINISHWDFLGLNSIQRKVLDCTQKKVLIDFQEIRMPKEEDGKLNKNLLGDETLKRPFEPDGPSLVCLASSRANLMAERMLCRMSGQPEFQTKGSDPESRLPFEFVWSRHQDFVFPSRFHLSPETAALDNPTFGEAVLGRKASGFKVKNKYYLDELTIEEQHEGYTYALCAAQMRERRKIWLLVAGLTGPATYAAASWVHQMATDLDHTKSGKPSPVYWSIVRAHAVKVTDPNRESYRVGEAEFVTGGEAWS